MTNPGTLVVNPDAASADSRFVAPELVALDAKGAPHLIGGRCAKCSAVSFPRAAVCTECLSEEVAETELAREGKLYSFSVVHQAPRGWTVPYALGYVDLSDDVRVLAHIDAPAELLSIDMPLRLSVGAVGIDTAGAPLLSYTFTPV
jgi:benzoylsuccinyl-CoA thiolase BbsA subunit